jgi:hypothetical protein
MGRPVRRLFTTAEARALGRTIDELRWGDRTGRWRRIERGVYGDGPEEPTALDRARAGVLASGGAARGRLAGVLLGLDSITVAGPSIVVATSGNGRRQGAQRTVVDPNCVICIDGVRCTNALQTLVDLARDVDDLICEQALESALRKRLTTIDDIARLAKRVRGVPRQRMQRVLALRPVGAPPTESLLETLMVQLARLVEGLPPPVRQLRILDEDGVFVARVDLCWPDLGIFIELDGQQHRGQPVYDVRRETAVVAATGWLCGRFTWTEVVRYHRTTARRLAALVAQARRRPMVP